MTMRNVPFGSTMLIRCAVSSSKAALVLPLVAPVSAAAASRVERSAA
jgi:hypothetical protein